MEKAIELGGLLAEQKETLSHGEFTPWIEANLPFTDRTARNYMRLHDGRYVTLADVGGDNTTRGFSIILQLYFA